MTARGACLLLASLLLCSLTRALPGNCTGTARVVDGDTLEVYARAPGDTTNCTLNGVKVPCTKIRMYGVDAPESAPSPGQSCAYKNGTEYPCGLVSKEALTRKVGTKLVSCAWNTTDYYGRHPATCKVDGEDLSSWLAAQGLAVAYRDAAGKLDYGGKYYLASESIARAAETGVWQGNFTWPALWRKLQDGYVPPNATEPVKDPPNPECPIKGNIGTERIYHVPSNGTYNSTTISEDEGERWFCSEEEALAAGWRPAGRAIKGNIGSDGRKIYHLPGGSYYDRTIIDTTAGERWFATEKEAQGAGWVKSTY